MHTCGVHDLYLEVLSTVCLDLANDRLGACGVPRMTCFCFCQMCDFVCLKKQSRAFLAVHSFDLHLFAFHGLRSFHMLAQLTY